MDIIQFNKLDDNNFIQMSEIDKTFYIAIIDKNEDITYLKKTINKKLAFNWYNFLYYSKLKS